MMIAIAISIVLPGGLALAQRSGNDDDNRGRNRDRQQEERQPRNWSNILDNIVNDSNNIRGKKDDNPKPQATTTPSVVATSTQATSTSTTTPVVSSVKPPAQNTQVRAATASVGLRSLRSIAGTLDQFLPLAPTYASTGFSVPVTWALSLLGLSTGIIGVLLATGKISPTTESVTRFFRTRINRFNPGTAVH